MTTPATITDNVSAASPSSSPASSSSAIAPLLVELFTEELPPKALRRLGDAFAAAIYNGLAARGLVPATAPRDDKAGAAKASAQATSVTPDGAPPWRMFATPRRLAVHIPAVYGLAPDRRIELKGPSLKVGLDTEGQPSQALHKWAQKQGVEVNALRKGHDGKQEVFFADSLVRGDSLSSVLSAVIDDALIKLPIPKVMQYQLADGRTNVSFVRPAHGLIALHGDQPVPASVLGLQSGRATRGHRFRSSGVIELADADAYEQALEHQGHVIAGFDTRRTRIDQALRARARELNASLGDETPVQTLLDEVTALVEWPAVYVGRFDAEFLQVPQECLILTMRTNQKYFPLFDAQGRLLPEFLIVSNMDVADPRFIIDGNQRVVRPRLADARFFFEQDKKTRLDARIPQLASVVYHAKLGTQAQRATRVATIAASIAGLLGQSPDLAVRAANLAKTDLVTGMVGEFPELQGVMGRYYALHDGEPVEVADAIAQQYQPRFAGDVLPASPTGTILALADKLETLTGMFGIGQHPTGDKDPFALRRHALGVLRMLIEQNLPLALDQLIDAAAAAFPSTTTSTVATSAAGPSTATASTAATEAKSPTAKTAAANTAAASTTAANRPPVRTALLAFFHDRLAGYLRELGYSANEVAAVVDQNPTRLADLPARLQALRQFAALSEAQALAAANKRIGNILKKNDGASAGPDHEIDPSRLSDPAERALADLITRLEPEVTRQMSAGNFTGALTSLAQARAPVDAFFEQVMVMADDPAVRRNRLAMLGRLRAMMNQVADISRLSTT